jgi:hypothetical protein
LDWIAEVGGWALGNFPELVSLIFAGVVAWTAIQSVKLNRRLVDAELDPAISVDLEVDRHRFQVLDLVIRNTGRGSARNVRFVVDPDEPIVTARADSRLTRMAIFRDGLKYLGPQQEIRTSLGSYLGLRKEPTWIHVTYERSANESATSKVFEGSFVLDVSQ